MEMERKRINASTLRSVGYDAGAQLLEIEFSDGSIVRYSGVSPEVHRRFMASPSPGSETVAVLARPLASVTSSVRLSAEVFKRERRS